MFKVGLTGGIASGKTTVSNLFQQLHVPVIDTDIISRELLNIDQPGYQQVITHFGTNILQSDAQIDRRKLRQLIFTQAREKDWLEAMLHPLIYQQTLLKISNHLDARYILVVIPLLFETSFQSLVDRVLVIDCSPETQIQRLLERDKIPPDLAQKMLDQQFTNAARLERADDIIFNNEGNTLDQQVTNLHLKYRALSA